MSGWTMKRFWTDVVVTPVDGGFTVALDSRPVHTPAKAVLRLPTKALANDVASEWEEIEEVVDPGKMPVTRMANSAIDKVGPQRDDIVSMLAGYAETDLLCYRADGPDGLVARQAAVWDPLLDWAAGAFGPRLAVTAGVLPATQDPAAIDVLRSEINTFSDFQLAGFHDLVTLPGSCIIGLAAANGLDVETLWDAARIDEEWQIAQWGRDEEAESVNRLKREAFLQAARFFGRAA